MGAPLRHVSRDDGLGACRQFSRAVWSVAAACRAYVFRGSSSVCNLLLAVINVSWFSRDAISLSVGARDILTDVFLFAAPIPPLTFAICHGLWVHF